MTNYLTELPTPQDHLPEGGAPMALHAVPDVPASPWIEPPKLTTFDPVIHASCVVEIASLAITYDPGPIPEPMSPNCGRTWTQELGRFDVQLVCTLPAFHRCALHAALDCDGVSHGSVIDERLVA